MRKILLYIVALLGCQQSYAQTPQGIPYQAAARNSSGAILASTTVSVRFSIRDSIATGAIKYRETHSITTTAQGLFSVNVGQGTPVTGTFSSINWGTNTKYMQVELDPTGGSTYIDMGTQQMMSVPYALYAGTSSSSSQWTTSGSNIYNTNTGKVGIGTSTPAARLHVADSSVVFTGPTEMWSGEYVHVPVNGSGNRLMWIPQIGAFRAGYAYDNMWSIDSVGPYSIAMGERPTASGLNATAIGHDARASGMGATALGNSRAYGIRSTAIGANNASYGTHALAMGNSTTASGDQATSFGRETIASGENSTAMGVFTTASGVSSTAMGYGTMASESNSTAMGLGSVASGYASTAMGNGTIANGAESVAIGSNSTSSGSYSAAIGLMATASGVASTAMGSETIASGERSTAMGYLTTASGMYSSALGTFVSTNEKNGSFAIGDRGDGLTGFSTPTVNDADNQMMMRFAGGYKLYTNAIATVGVSLAEGGNSWATISDRNKKENFAAVDGDAFLKKIANINLTSWNYKGQDPATHRHYGPMAQDFYAAFGKDQYGTIGNDTTISQADMEGVSVVAIQALVRENEAIKAKINQLSTENKELKAELTNRIEILEQKMLKAHTASK